jgi:hypothetical protein
MKSKALVKGGKDYNTLSDLSRLMRTAKIDEKQGRAKGCTQE